MFSDLGYQGIVRGALGVQPRLKSWGDERGRRHESRGEGGRVPMVVAPMGCTNITILNPTCNPPLHHTNINPNFDPSCPLTLHGLDQLALVVYASDFACMLKM